jgi:hypothetical protein
MNTEQLQEVGQRWLATSEAWRFDTSTVVKTLPDLDAWVVGKAGDATALIGTAGDRAIAVVEEGVAGIRTVTGKASQLQAAMRDTFTDMHRSHPLGGGHVGRHQRVWTFALADVEVTVQHGRAQIYGETAAAGADDTGWGQRRAEERCRELAFGVEVELEH